MSDVMPNIESTNVDGDAEDRADSLPNLIMEHTEFFSTLSHELRTPLATIKGFGQTLVAHWDQLPDERKLHHVEHILRSTARLERLVGDLSLSTHLVDGVSLHLSTVDVADVVAQAVLEACVLHPDRIFMTEPPTTSRHMRADRDRLLQVLVNLLDNAAKYSPAEEPITVSWTDDGDLVRTEIRDSGLGLSQEDQASLFIRYGRLPAASHRGGIQAGSGLGLYICKGLVEAMQGSIGTMTGVSGLGNTFWFTLPCAGEILTMARA